jgi:hypothetical protein
MVEPANKPVNMPASSLRKAICAVLLPQAAWAVALLTAAAAHAEVACPGQLSVQQRAEAPAGWNVAYGEPPFRLAEVTLFDGPPAGRASLKYDERKQSARELTLVWKLRESPRSHYLQCAYERTAAVISMALPPGVRVCEVVFDRTSGYPGAAMPVKRMVCH